MSCTISLPIWPSSLDCVDWSQDNYIAVGGGDQVAILTPRFHDPDANGSYWTSTFFKVNAFTAEEVPLMAPLSFNNFSPAEEISLRHVQALKWSPPGLAKFARCFLAILSANHVLSLWQCEGRPEVDSHWKRTIIVNHTLQRYYDRNARDSGRGPGKSESRQVQQRVRAFSWSHSLSFGQSSRSEGLTKHFQQNNQLLAVSTEAGDVLLLQVQSSHDVLLSGRSGARVEVVLALSINELSATAAASTSSPPATLASPNEKTLVADHLALSGYAGEHEGSKYRVNIAFITNGQLFCVKLEMERTVRSSSADWHQLSFQRLISSRSDMTGPLRFVPELKSLTSFAADAAFCINILADWNAGSSITEHHLDGRWDEISGSAISSLGTQQFTMNMTSHLSSATAKTTAYSLPSMTDTTSSAPAWQSAIKKTKTDFSAAYSLDGNVIERIWGIASSPLASYFATATTTLPSDAIAYIIASDQHTVINIWREAVHGEDDVLAGMTRLPLDAASETALFYLQRQLDEQRIPLDGDAHLHQAQLAAKESTARGNGFADDPRAVTESTSTDQIISHLRQRVFVDPGLRDNRTRLLVDMASRKVSTGDQLSKQVVQRLIAEVLETSSQFDQITTLSKNIVQVCRAIAKKLENREESGIQESTDREWTEDCRICRQPIQFESIKWARCEAGHQFSRCALTYFALQEPSISKQCKICRSQYLNEWRIAELRLQGEGYGDSLEGAGDTATHQVRVDFFSSGNAAIEPPSSLARVLFTAFDKCIYCGGKFVA